MSATNRTQESAALTLDPADSPSALKKFEAEVARISFASGLDPSHVRNVLNTARTTRRKTKRSKGDFYETPAWVVDAIVPFLPFEGEPIVLDAGSGTGAISARLAEINRSAEIIGVEKQAHLVEQARARGVHNAEFRVRNFLNDEIEMLRSPDIVIMNPPFSFAEEFVKRGLQIVRRGGVVCALLRLNWLGSKSRRDFLKKHVPNVHVLSKRPSFTGGGTDACEYAWMTWRAGSTGPTLIESCRKLASSLDMPIDRVLEAGSEVYQAGASSVVGRVRVLTHDDQSKRRRRAARS